MATTLLPLSTLRRIVLALAGEANDDASRQFSSDDITDALNSAWSLTLLNLGYDSYFRVSRTLDATTGSIAAPDADEDGEILGSHNLLFRSSSTAQPVALALLDPTQMDLNVPNWRNETAAAPTGYAPQIAPDATETFLLYPQPTATVTNGLTQSWIPRPVEMEDDDDESPAGRLFPHRQRTLLVYGAMMVLFPMDGSGEDDEAEGYREKWMREVMGCRSDLAMRYSGGAGMSRRQEGVGLRG